MGETREHDAGYFSAEDQAKVTRNVLAMCKPPTTASVPSGDAGLQERAERAADAKVDVSAPAAQREPDGWIIEVQSRKTGTWKAVGGGSGDIGKGRVLSRNAAEREARQWPRDIYDVRSIEVYFRTPPVEGVAPASDTERRDELAAKCGHCGAYHGAEMALRDVLAQYATDGQRERWGRMVMAGFMVRMAGGSQKSEGVQPAAQPAPEAGTPPKRCPCGNVVAYPGARECDDCDPSLKWTPTTPAEAARDAAVSPPVSAPAAPREK